MKNNENDIVTGPKFCIKISELKFEYNEYNIYIQKNCCMLMTLIMILCMILTMFLTMIKCMCLFLFLFVTMFLCLSMSKLLFKPMTLFLIMTMTMIKPMIKPMM